MAALSKSICIFLYALTACFQDDWCICLTMLCLRWMVILAVVDVLLCCNQLLTIWLDCSLWTDMPCRCFSLPWRALVSLSAFIFLFCLHPLFSLSPPSNLFYSSSSAPFSICFSSFLFCACCVLCSDPGSPKKCRARFGLNQQTDWCGPCRCVPNIHAHPLHSTALLPSNKLLISRPI